MNRDIHSDFKQIRNNNSKINKTLNQNTKSKGIEKNKRRGFTESHCSLDNSNNSSIQARPPTKISLY